LRAITDPGARPPPTIEPMGHRLEQKAAARAAQSAGIDGTPTVVVSGPRGGVQYDRSQTVPAVPTLASLAALIQQVG